MVPLAIRGNELVVGRSLVRRTNLLKTVNRPLGASFTIFYQRQGNTYNQPSSSWVMSAVEVNDGHPGDGVDKLVTTRMGFIIGKNGIFMAIRRW